MSERNSTSRKQNLDMIEYDELRFYNKTNQGLPITLAWVTVDERPSWKGDELRVNDQKAQGGKHNHRSE